MRRHDRREMRPLSRFIQASLVGITVSGIEKAVALRAGMRRVNGIQLLFDRTINNP